MANFDEALESYRTQRDALRKFQGEIQRKVNERLKLDREIKVDVKKYDSMYKKLLVAVNDLTPALQAEVNGAASNLGNIKVEEQDEAPVESVEPATV